MNILNQLYFLAISHLPASTVATISGALESAFNNNVKPEMKAIGNIIMYIISGVHHHRVRRERRFRVERLSS